jgi:hypothetical protein
MLILLMAMEEEETGIGASVRATNLSTVASVGGR